MYLKLAVSVSHTALALSRSCTRSHVCFSCGSQKGFVQKLVQRIVDNIEINVADIHIRCAGICFSFPFDQSYLVGFTPARYHGVVQKRRAEDDVAESLSRCRFKRSPLLLYAHDTNH